MFTSKNSSCNSPYYPASQRRLAISLLLLPFFCGCNQIQVAEFGFNTLLLFIEMIGVPVSIYVLIRMAAVQMAARFMQIRTTGHTDETTHEEPAFTTPANIIRFEEYREKENLLPGNEAANYFIKAISAGNAGWQLFKKAMILFITGIIAILFMVRFFYGTWLSNMTPFLLFFSGIIYLSAYLRYVALRRLPLSSACTAFMVLMLLFILVAGLIEESRQYLVFYLILLLITLVFLVMGYRRNNRGDALNRQLLILRIFGSDGHTAFLFREISRTWRFLGSLITIADPSYLRYQYSISSRENRRRFYGFFILYFIIMLSAAAFLKFQLLDSLPSGFVIIWEQTGALSAGFILGVAIMTFSLLFLLPPVIIVVYRRFISSTAKLTRAVQKITNSKKSPSGTFKSSTLFCIDNTWRKAVQQMLLLSKVVLMDLRGFSKQNNGCKYELELLIDSYPVNKILLLADEGPGLELIKKIIKEKWQRMLVTSPNANLPEPVLKIYFPGVEDKSDIIHITALLTMSLANKQELPATGLAAQTDAGYTLQNKKLKLPPYVMIKDGSVVIRPAVTFKKPTSIGIFEKLDLALAKPSVGKWFIPAFLLLLAGRCIYKMYPIYKSYAVYNTAKKIQAQPGREYNTDTTGMPGITITALNGEYIVEIAGGKIEGAYKCSDVKIKLLTANGLSLADDIISGIMRPQNAAWQVLRGNSPNSSRVIFFGIPQVNTSIVSPSTLQVKMKLFYIAPQDVLIAGGLDTLLAQTGLVQIEFNDSTGLKKMWLQRSSTVPGQVYIIFVGDWDDYDTRLLNPDGELKTIQEQSVSGVLQFHSSPIKNEPYHYADFKNAWLEIMPTGKIDTVSWSFETKNIGRREEE